MCFDREQLVELWNDMWKEGNWIPSWPDSLNGVNADMAAWKPRELILSRSIWEETVHVTFWRKVTLNHMAGGSGPSEEEVDRLEFAVPELLNESSWGASISDLRETQHKLAAAILNTELDISRIPYHLIHDAYHLGRITLIRRELDNDPAIRT